MRLKGFTKFIKSCFADVLDGGEILVAAAAHDLS